MFRKLLYVNQAKWEPKYKKVLQVEFEKQKKEIFSNHPSSKTIVKDLNEWMFDVKKSDSRIIGELMPNAIELVIQQAKLALDIADDKETEFLINQRVKAAVADRMKLLATSVNDTTVKKLKKTISEGLTAGESVDKIKQRVSDVYEQAGSVRAEMIARTETIAASNEAVLEGYKQSPVVTYKEWFANPGACEFCDSINSQVYPLGQSFADLGGTVEGSDGGTFAVDYDDINTPPLHVNCRCTILPVY